MSWREHFGMDEELERIQPGHTLGCIAFYAILALGFAALIYGVRP